MFVKAGACRGQAVRENAAQVSGSVVYGVQPPITNGQYVYVIVCHKSRRYIMHFWCVYLGLGEYVSLVPVCVEVRVFHRLCMSILGLGLFRV